MSQTNHTDVAVETPTNYADDLDAENPIVIDIQSLDPDMYVELCQRLSLILEKPDETDASAFTDPLVRMHDTFPVDFARSVSAGATYTIAVEVEGLSDADAQLAVETFTTAVTTGDTSEARTALDILLSASTDASGRSIVRLIRNDGSARPDLEWHTAP